MVIGRRRRTAEIFLTRGGTRTDVNAIVAICKLIAAKTASVRVTPGIWNFLATNKMSQLVCQNF